MRDDVNRDPPLSTSLSNSVTTFSHSTRGPSQIARASEFVQLFFSPPHPAAKFHLLPFWSKDPGYSFTSLLLTMVLFPPPFPFQTHRFPSILQTARTSRQIEGDKEMRSIQPQDPTSFVIHSNYFTSDWRHTARPAQQSIDSVFTIRPSPSPPLISPPPSRSLLLPILHTSPFSPPSHHLSVLLSPLRSPGSNLETCSSRRDSSARRPGAETLIRTKHHESTKRLEKRKSQSRK